MYTNGGEETSNRRPIVETYAALYKGRTKIMRLLFIANHCGGNHTIQLEALRMAYDEIKKGENTQLFREVVNKINGKLGDKYEMDLAWCESVDRRAEQKKAKLENELRSYRTNLIKESIRMGYNDLGDFYYACGSLEDAFRNYIQPRRFCTTDHHIINLCMNAILVSIEMGDFSRVPFYVAKAKRFSDNPLDPIVIAKFLCASGLAHLEEKQYKSAARKFLDVIPELGNSYNEVIAPEDVATYGGLCALATFNQSELKQKVIDNINFRNFLELVPNVRELINDFYSSRYASCLEHLESLKPNLLLDIHLHDHVDTLYDQIREKALIHHTMHTDEVDLSTMIHHTMHTDEVDLSTMADSCQTSVSGLEKEPEALITTDVGVQVSVIDMELQDRLKTENKEFQERIADMEKKLFEGELLRKKLHNTILELKGNIRVFCRVRPLVADDGVRHEATVIAYPTSLEARGRGVDLVQNGNTQSFIFDKVFNQEASQEEVFFEISQLVQSALDGHKVCIFAYGQTGSGKTYTMMGGDEGPEQKGLIPRSLEQIFQAIESLSAQGWKYKIQVSMLEIYNETIRDLLSTPQTTSKELVRADGVTSGKEYTITHDVNGNTHVKDLTVCDVCGIATTSSLLQRAARSRSVGKTQMNEQSWRSHFVFTMRISGVNESIEQPVQGVLNLIDLAGSERLSKSGATGERLKETTAINSSLSALSDVIFALSKKEGHVPFRNSKLTYLLQPCFGGDSKVLMLVNISPVPSSAGESLNSLRFASRAGTCVPRGINIKSPKSKVKNLAFKSPCKLSKSNMKNLRF